jgi:hypothetical protein
VIYDVKNRFFVASFFYCNIKTPAMKTQDEKNHDSVVLELRELDKETVDVGQGVRLKPSQCYSFSLDPKPHFLFNTNCPDELKEKVSSILKKYFKENE